MHRRHGLAAGERARRPARPTARPTVPSAPAVSRAGYAWAMAEQDDETYRDQAGRRRRWHLASPEEREARDAQARQLHDARLSYREIAQQLGCGRGTVARAVRNAPPPNRIIRGQRVDGRPVVTIGRTALRVARCAGRYRVESDRHRVGTFRCRVAPARIHDPAGGDGPTRGLQVHFLVRTRLSCEDRSRARAVGSHHRRGAGLAGDVPRDEGGDGRAAAAGGQAGATVPSVTVTPGRTRYLAARTTGSVVLTRERPG